MTDLYISDDLINANAMCRCDNCDDEVKIGALERVVTDAQERLTPGFPIPAGECKKCGALSYIVNGDIDGTV